MIIDVSKHQGNIDWDKVDVEFVYIKATQALHIDPKFADNVEGARANNIPFHVYHFLTAKTKDEAEAEAGYFYGAASKYNPISYVVDAEDNSIPKDMMHDVVSVFIDTLRKCGAKRIGIYCSEYWFGAYGLKDIPADYLWIARWGEKRPTWKCDVWQYSDHGKVAGISGDVDFDAFVGDTKSIDYFTKGGDSMAKIVMTDKELIHKLWDIVNNYKTIYMYAAYGFKVTDATISGKAKQNLNGWYTPNNITKLKKVANQNPPYWGFDCVNLLKAILWGWNGDTSKDHGGAVYGANGVPDTSANGMIKKCYDVSDDFSNILPGEGLWMEGHWGTYVGDGLAIECTTRWDDCVQVTAVLNIGKKQGFNGRKWSKHGKLPWIAYSGIIPEPVPEPVRMTVLSRGSRGAEVRDLQKHLIELGYDCGKWGADGDFGSATENAVMQFQKDHGLTVDGKFGPKSASAMEKALSEKANPHTVCIKGGNCYVRTAPNKNGEILGVAYDGNVLPYQGVTSENGWHLVIFNNQNGWVSGKYGKVI